MFLHESMVIKRVPLIEDILPPPSAETQVLPTPERPAYHRNQDHHEEYPEDDGCIVQRSRSSLRYEVELVNWIRQHTTIPAPKPVHHGFHHTSGQYVALFEKPQGRPLSDCWEELTTAHKDSVVLELRGYVNQLRAITTAQIPNLRARDRFIDPNDGVMRGPHHSTQSFLDEIAGRIDRIGSLYEPGATRKALRFLESLKNIPVEHEAVFTHGNILPENIYVDNQGKVIALTDWSEAGYAPAFWEYVKSYVDDDDTSFSIDGVPDSIMQAWPVALSIMMHVHRIIW